MDRHPALFFSIILCVNPNAAEGSFCVQKIDHELLVDPSASLGMTRLVVLFKSVGLVPFCQGKPPTVRSKAPVS